MNEKSTSFPPFSSNFKVTMQAQTVKGAALDEIQHVNTWGTTPQTASSKAAAICSRTLTAVGGGPGCACKALCS